MNAKKIYLFFIFFYAFLIALSVLVFSMMPIPASYLEGFFITLGNASMEWIFAIIMPGIVGTVSCLISIYFISPVIKEQLRKGLKSRNPKYSKRLDLKSNLF